MTCSFVVFIPPQQNGVCLSVNRGYGQNVATRPLHDAGQTITLTGPL